MLFVFHNPDRNVPLQKDISSHQEGQKSLVQAASRQLAKQSSVMDAQLFTIKQLLILREQIAPFEADFAVTEYDLDFSHMRDHLRRIMAGALPYCPDLRSQISLVILLFFFLEIS